MQLCVGDFAELSFIGVWSASDSAASNSATAVVSLIARLASALPRRLRVTSRSAHTTHAA